MQCLLLLLSLQLCVTGAFQPRGPTFRASGHHLSMKAKGEERLLELISSLSGRGSGLSAPEALPQKLEIESLISTLETAGLTQARDERLLNGCWKLLYTSTPGNTQSPIQRSLTGFDGVSIYQVINIDTAASNSFLGEGLPDVSNTVVFGDGIGRLRITALASTCSRKLVEPRVGDGTFFGLAPFGKSFAAPPRLAEERIDFAFQEALFEFKEPFRFTIPYPVPFKLLGDEAKGFIDNTYYSSSFRIARGNKGTVFLLQKADVAKDSAAATAMAKVFPPPLPAVASKEKSRKKKPCVAILFPSQLGTVNDYDDFTALIEKEAGIKVYVSPLERLDWPLGLVGTFFTRDFFGWPSGAQQNTGLLLQESRRGCQQGSGRESRCRARASLSLDWGLGGASVVVRVGGSRHQESRQAAHLTRQPTQRPAVRLWRGQGGPDSRSFDLYQ